MILNDSLKRNLLINSSTKSYVNLIKKLNLQGFEDPEKKITSTTVSGGEAIRIALLRNLIAPPNVLLIDEPFAPLDLQNKNLASDFINIYSQKKPIICVTHEIPIKLKVKNVLHLA